MNRRGEDDRVRNLPKYYVTAVVAPGLDLIDELSRNDWHVLWRARRRLDSTPVLLKLPCQHPPPALALVLLEHEREILRHVTVPGVLNARDLTPMAGGPGLSSTIPAVCRSNGSTRGDDSTSSRVSMSGFACVEFSVSCTALISSTVR